MHQRRSWYLVSPLAGEEGRAYYNTIRLETTSPESERKRGVWLFIMEFQSYYSSIYDPSLEYCTETNAREVMMQKSKMQIHFSLRNINPL